MIMQAVPHRRFDIHEPGQVAELRSAAQAQAQALGFDAAAAERVARVAAELSDNLLKHARQGRMLLAPVQGDDGAPLLELMSLDDGPRIKDIDRTGCGLEAVRQASTLFDIHTAMPQGTVIVARIGAAAPSPTAGLQCGAALLCAPGATVCGNAWALERDESRCALLLADASGQGLCAAEAAQAAVNTFRADPWGPPGQLVERAHAALGSERGASVCTLQVDLARRRIVHAGIGTIRARLLSGTEDHGLRSQRDSADAALQSVPEQWLDWPPHALLVLHSDGIRSRWQLGAERSLLQHHPALLAAWLVCRHLRGRDDATCVVLKLSQRQATAP
jgi:hypothetical protein